jgi:hypothetical protein
MIRPVSSGHNSFENARKITFPSGTKQQVFKFRSQAQSNFHPPPPSVRDVTKKNGDSGAERVLCAAVCDA